MTAQSPTGTWRSLLEATSDGEGDSYTKTLIIVGGSEDSQRAFIETALTTLHSTEPTTPSTAIETAMPVFQNTVGMTYHYIEYLALAPASSYHSALESGNVAPDLLVHLDIYAVDRQTIHTAPESAARLLREACALQPLRDILIFPLLDGSHAPTFLSDLVITFNNVITPMLASKTTPDEMAKANTWHQARVDSFRPEDLTQLGSAANHPFVTYPCSVMVTVLDLSVSRLEAQVSEYIQNLLRVVALAMGASLCYLGSQPGIPEKASPFAALVRSVLSLDRCLYPDRPQAAAPRITPTLTDKGFTIPVGWDTPRKIRLSVEDNPAVSALLGDIDGLVQAWKEELASGVQGLLSQYAKTVTSPSEIASPPLAPSIAAQASCQNTFQAFLRELGQPQSTAPAPS